MLKSYIPENKWEKTGNMLEKIFTEEINEYMNESIYHLTYSTINKSEINIIL